MPCSRLLKANDAVRERQQGKVVDTPKAPDMKVAGASSRASKATLNDLLLRWEQERNPTARAKQEWEFVVRRFGELNGKLPVGHIEKRHVLAYKDQMMADRAAPATINKHLAALGSLLQLAVDNDLCGVNVAKGIRVRGSKVSEESRLPYDTPGKLKNKCERGFAAEGGRNIPRCLSGPELTSLVPGRIKRQPLGGNDFSTGGGN